ncbi:Forkhead-associated (FHA) domain [Dillenia turbinata]|uniref:Forkhead-associated (FHA) domain n=1 Tax=Dillenia turbinata TaxID=194707 RepID=A0AAN8V2C9_9MAGN
MISIKDAGISSKHLLVNFISNRWKISNLGMSNRTFINGISILASKPWGLEEGDIVKIREYTSFKISIQDEESANQVEKRVTRGHAKYIRASKEENLGLNKRCSDGERVENGVGEDGRKIENLGNVVENKIKRGRGKKFTDLKNEPEIEKCDDANKLGILGNGVKGGRGRRLEI